jgi:deoxyribonuclease-4
MAVRLGIAFFVIHPGNHMGAGEKEGIRLIAESLRSILSELRDEEMSILLETAAGQGTSLGYRFEHLADIMDACNAGHQLGVCLDTCHLFAAGYDFRTPAQYAAFREEIDARIGLGNVHAIHVNDSVKELGSRVDRHAHIGKGRIGLPGMSCLLTDVRMTALPMILETPKGIGIRLDRKNLKLLKTLRAGEHRD